MPTAYLMSGPPGCGKSRLAATLHYTVVSRDEVRATMRRENSECTEDEIWAEVLRQVTEELSAGKDVVLDSTLSSSHRRNEAVEVCGRFGEVWLYISRATLGECLDRNRQREGGACLRDTEVKRLFDAYRASLAEPCPGRIDRTVYF